MSRLVRASALALLTAVLAGTAVSAWAQETGLGIRLVDLPDEVASDGRSQLYITDHLQPGMRIERTVEVGNDTGSPMTVQLYSADASTDGGWVVGAGRGTSEVSSWIDVVPDTVRLGAGESTRAQVVIEVPEDASGGERYAAIVAEAPPRDRGDGVAVVSRVGVRVYLSVGGPTEPVSDFVIDSLSAGRSSDGQPLVIIEVTNVGQRALDISGQLELSEGPGSLKAGPFPVASPTTVGIGASSTVMVVLDRDIPAGPWLARTELASGNVVRAAEATIRFPDEAGEVRDPVAAQMTPVERQRRVLIPVAGGLIALTGILLVILLLSRRDKRGQEEQTAEVA